MQRRRIELYRRRGGQDERAVRGVEIAVRKAKHVAGEARAVALVVHGEMVLRVAGGVDAPQRPACQLNHVSVRRFDHPFGRNRAQSAVGLFHH